VCETTWTNCATIDGRNRNFDRGMGEFKDVYDRVQESASEVSMAHQATAVALRFGSTLVTLDREQRERVAGVVTSRLPAEALGEWA
jgi:hypothetical protein